MRLKLHVEPVTDKDIEALATAMWFDGIGRVLTVDSDCMYRPSVPDIAMMIWNLPSDTGSLTIDCEGPEDLECPFDEHPFCPSLDEAVKAMGSRVLHYQVTCGHDPQETPNLVCS